MDESAQPLLSMLRRMPPSKELLDFYHKKLEQFAEEEQKWLQRLSEAKRASDRSIVIERDLIASKREISALQKAVADIRNALAQERRINLKLQKENDKLRIRELENRRKVIALLELSGKSDKEVTKVLDDADKMRNKSNLPSNIDDFIPQRLVDFMEKAKADPSRFAALKRSAESGRLEILALENQLMEQERCHLEQISEMENERRLAARDREAERTQFERRITELSQSIKSLEGNQESYVDELGRMKSEHRREERRWMSEKEFLLRKLQFVQHYGTAFPATGSDGVPGGAFFTDQRSSLRKGGDMKNHRDLQKLNTELAEQKKLTEDYRTQLLALESEMDFMRDENCASKDVLKQRTKAMVEQVEHLKEKYESLEQRRKVEAQGYQTDVKILQDKLRHVEQKLVRATLAKVKEHDYIKTINAYEREVEKLKRSLKSSGEWIN